MTSDSLKKIKATESDLKNLKDLYATLKQSTDQTIQALNKKIDESNNDESINEFFDEMTKENLHLTEKIKILEGNQTFIATAGAATNPQSADRSNANGLYIDRSNERSNADRSNERSNADRSNEDFRISNMRRKITDGDYNDFRSNDPIIGTYCSRGNANGSAVYMGPNSGLYYYNKYNHLSYLSSDKKNSYNIRF